MSMLDGCMGKYATPAPEEKPCPRCHAAVEVFARAGKQVEDVRCPVCGYVLPKQHQPVFTKKKPEADLSESSDFT